MRYLKKFESKSDFYQDVMDNFIEFTDDEIAYSWKDDGFISFEFSLDIEPSDIDNDIELTSKKLEILKDIKTSISRLEDKWGNLIVRYKYHDFSSFIIEIFEPNNTSFGDFYIKRDKLIILDKDKIKDILKIDKNVELSVWSSGSSDRTLKIEFTNESQFMSHMYRDYVDRREDLPNGSFNNETVEDALIINPELMERYIKLGNNFSKLKIDGEDLVKKIEYISKGQSKSYYGTRGSYSKEEWSLSLILNKKFRYKL